jgi:UDP-glucuronate decarboxylase
MRKGDRHVAGNSKRRILVTGGAGFLGSHLCDRLMADGHAVICLDNYVTGRAENVAHLLANPDFSVVEHDVVHPIDLEVDEIYNLACPASPVAYSLDPIQTTKTSVLGSLNLLELATRRGIRIFQASTSEVYGDPLVTPQSETYRGNVDPTGPRACYDEGKRCAETLFFDFHRRFGTRIKVARIFNTYGPRMQLDDGRVVSNFVVQALRREDLTVYGDGRQTRSFCYVDDLIDGFVRLMEAPDPVTGPINLGNPDEFRIGDFARIVLAHTGSQSAIARRPLPVDDPRQRCPDISKAKQVLGWEPKVDIEEGLARTIPYFAERIEATAEDR